MIWDPFSLSPTRRKRSLLHLMLYAVRDQIWFWTVSVWNQEHSRKRSLNFLLRLNPEPAFQGVKEKKETASGVTFTSAAFSNRFNWQYHNMSFAHKLWWQAENPLTSEKVAVEKGLEAVEHNGSSNLQVQGDQGGIIHHFLLPKQPFEQKACYLAGD